MCFLALPFVMAWGLVGWIFSAVGRIVAIAIGLSLIAAGAALCLTIIGIIIGAPLAAFGGALVFRAVFH